MNTRWDLLMAASTAMSLPVILLFFFAQRYFIQGIVRGGATLPFESANGRLLVWVGQGFELSLNDLPYPTSSQVAVGFIIPYRYTT